MKTGGKVVTPFFRYIVTALKFHSARLVASLIMHVYSSNKPLPDIYSDVQSQRRVELPSNKSIVLQEQALKVFVH